MASITTGLIQKIKINDNNTQNIASTAYGVCSTAADTAAKTVDMTGFELNTGITVHIKFTHGNIATNAPTLSINGSTAKPIVQYGSTDVGTIAETSGWQDGAILSLTYDGTSWVRDQGYNTNTTYTFGNGTNGFTVTPLGGIAQTITVTPSITNNITGSGTNGSLVKFSGANTITDGPAFNSTHQDKYLRMDGTWQTVTGGVSSVATLTGDITASDLISQLGLSHAMHFRGIATVTIAEDSKTDPVISGYTFGTNGASAKAGDVILDKDYKYEYVWTSDGNTGVWEQLGEAGSYATVDHSHGNITKDGKITTDITLAENDYLIIGDNSAGGIVGKGPAFSATITGQNNTHKFLREDGAWAVPSYYTHPTGDGNSHVPATSTSSEGLYLKAGSGINSAAWAAPTVWHGICTTAAGTAIKDVTCPSFPTGANLAAGTVIFVYFTNTNSCAVNDIKLRVNSTSSGHEKAIKYLYNGEDPANIPDKGYLKGGQTYYFTYDGTYWVVRLNYDTDTTPYGVRVYRDTVSNSAFNNDYPLLVSRSLASDIASAYSNDIYAIINNSDTTKIPTYNPYSGELKAPKFIGNVTGAVTGNADTATAWANARKVYVDLNTASTTVTINGDASASAEAIGIGVNGVLKVANGGTGKDSLTSGYALIGNGTSAVNLRQIVNNDSATAITTDTTNNSLVTVNTVYHGLPTINNVHNYTSSTTIYAPTDGGTANHILIANGATSTPTWTTNATLVSNSSGDTLTLGVSTKKGSIELYDTAANTITTINAKGWSSGGKIEEYTILGITSTTANTDAFSILTLGNNIAKSSTTAHTQGALRLYSSGTTYTEIVSQEEVTSPTSKTLYLPKYNDDMYVVHASSNAMVGSTTQPVYVAENGRITALTYTANRLYYTGSTSSVDPTNHYSTDTILHINDADTSYTTNNPRPSANLYVNGTTLLNGTLSLTGNIAPTTTNTYTLGIAAAGTEANARRWSNVYIGTDDTYGDNGLPIYWNNGVPEATYPLQYANWEITSGSYVTLDHNKYYADTHVIQVVITSGASYLPGPLSFTSSRDSNGGHLQISTTGNVAGTVSGYVLTARAETLSFS